MDSAELHRQLLDPTVYPDKPATVTFCETHISRVYLTDHFAYKLKKPLNLGFLDFSTLAKRRFFCHEELVLNRRFAPATYLEVRPVRCTANRVTLNGRGRIIDYAVCMRRLPEERMLSHLLDENDPDLPVAMEQLARHLATLLGSATPCLGEETAETVREKLAGNLRQTVPAIGLTLGAEAHALMTACMDRELRRLSSLIEQRATDGYVRDGHGDLHAANICMTEPITVYDCIEFCRRFRVADVAADLAFLLMDLDFRNRRDLAGIFLASYQRQASDPALANLLPLYKSYRAWVRGKVATLLAMEGDVEAEHRQQALDEARRYFNLALGYQIAPTLILLSGLMGVGKSSLAKALAVASGAHLLRSDVIRKELAGLPADRPCAEPFGSGLYTTQMTVRTYTELRRRAASLLGRGETVIVDASFSRTADRTEFIDMASSLGRPVLLLQLHCDPTTTLERLDQRQHQGLDPSDGRRDIYRQQAATFDPFSPGMPCMEIDSAQPVDYNAQVVLCQLMQR